MTTAEDFLLVMTDPASGKATLGSMETGPLFGGALLLDLVAAGRLALDGEGRRARVVVVDDSPVDDPVLQAAFDRLRTKKSRRPQSAVEKLGKKGQARTYESLIAKGAMRTRDEKALGIISLTRHDVISTERRDDLLRRILATLLDDQPADSETGPIIALLSATDLTTELVGKPDRKRAKTRAKEIAEGDWASEGVRKAVQSALAVITAALVAGSVGSAAS